MTTTLWRLALATFLTVFLYACEENSDEDQIAQIITAMKESVEARSFTDIEKHLTGDFVANGRLDKKDVKQLLQLHSFQHKKIGATIIGSKTAMDATFPDRAETTLSVVVTGSSGRLPSDGSIRTVKLQWVKHAGDWQVRKAAWQHYQ